MFSFVCPPRQTHHAKPFKSMPELKIGARFEIPAAPPDLRVLPIGSGPALDTNIVACSGAQNSIPQNSILPCQAWRGEVGVRTHTLMREKFPVLPVPPGPTGSRRMLEWVQLNLSAIRLFTMHRSKCAHLRKRCLQIVNSQCSRFLSQTLEGSPYSALKERLECLGPSLQDDSGARARLVGEGTEG